MINIKDLFISFGQAGKHLQAQIVAFESRIKATKVILGEGGGEVARPEQIFNNGKFLKNWINGGRGRLSYSSYISLFAFNAFDYFFQIFMPYSIF